MQPILFNFAKIEDGERLVAIRRMAMASTLSSAYSKEVIESILCGFSIEDFPRLMKEGELFELASIGPNIIGFSGTKKNRLESLFVDPNYMRQGVGSTLLTRAEDRIRSRHEKIVLTATLVSVNFYLHHGYIRMGEKPQRTRGGLYAIATDMERTFAQGSVR
jgi:GNAT superfamily N-acetyltransferase